MAYRDIAARMFRRKVQAFESINNSIDFAEDRDVFLGSAPKFQDRMSLHEYVSSLVGQVQITYLEFGVWQGESFRKWLSLNNNPDSRFIGFDTFTGLPEDWTPTDPKGKFSTAGQLPAIDDSRASFVRGMFQDTLYKFLEKSPPVARLIVHIDCDLYSSTLFTLSVLDRYFEKGAVLIFDDFHSLNHEFAAWRDYRRSFLRSWKPLGKTQLCIQAAFELAP